MQKDCEKKKRTEKKNQQTKRTEKRNGTTANNSRKQQQEKNWNPNRNQLRKLGPATDMATPPPLNPGIVQAEWLSMGKVIKTDDENICDFDCTCN